MPIIFQKRIYRIDLTRNPHIHYLFGDNEHRSGYGGHPCGSSNPPANRHMW